MTRLRTSILAAAAALLAVSVFLMLAAKAYGTATKREVMHRYLSDALVQRVEPAPNVEWVQGNRPLVRDFTQTDEAKIGKAIDDAWQAHAAAMATGQIGFLPDYFSGVALDRAEISALSGFDNDTRMVILDHVAKPSVYHLDGSVLQAEAKSFAVRFALDANQLSAFDITLDGTVTTFMNETSGWRVFSHERNSAEDPERGSATYEGGALAGINYYPAETPWFEFWPNFDPDLVARDLVLIKNLGANSVRMFLARRDFLDPTVADAHIESLRMFLQLTDRAGLLVVPTLFDLKPEYETGSWPDDVRYLKRVLPVLNEASNIAFIDLKNEPDLDGPHHGEGLVEAWLRSMAAYVRQNSPQHPLTVGWSSAEAATQLIDVLDVVTYHDYAPIEGAADRLADLRVAAGSKPVMVTEIGSSAWSVAAGYPGSEKAQAADLASRFNALRDADGVFVWTLHDFPEPDVRVIGHSPWVRGLQSAFGLFDMNGDPRASVDVVRKAFDNFN